MNIDKRTHVEIPVRLMQEITNYLLECKAKETFIMLTALNDLETKYKASLNEVKDSDSE